MIVVLSVFAIELDLKKSISQGGIALALFHEDRKAVSFPFFLLHERA
jgi:hypothetical protein